MTDDPHKPYISVSTQIEQRFRRRFWVRRCAAIIYMVTSIIYLAWRFTIINPDSIMLSTIYYVAECFGFILGLTAIFSSWNHIHRQPPPAPSGLSVDVFIPTYREPLDIIRRTAIAAKHIEYPHQTWILDDGNQTEVRQLADSLGINYLARSENTNAKAGNLNYGLQHSNADFVTVFDADHIAQPNALHTMLGFFNDEKIALVQTPQDYYNIDAFQYMNPRRKAGLWHDQSFFYNIGLSNQDTHDAASCAGTGVTYRRSALDAIGGIPTETITEDIHTSLKLHKGGHQTIYLKEPVAYGIAAADLNDYYRTRHRWAHGNLAALKHENIFFCQGLSLGQRLSYLSLGLIYLEGWQQLMLLIVPIIALVFGLAPFEITIFNVLLVLSFPILTLFLLQEVGCGFSRYWTNEIFAMARWPIHIISVTALFGKKLPWKSSIKNIKGHIDWHLMLPQISVLLISLMAVGWAVLRLADDFHIGPLGHAVLALLDKSKTISQIDIYAEMPAGYSIELVVIASFWALFNASRAFYFITKAIWNAKNSHEYYRFSLPLVAALPDYSATLIRTEQVSEEWIRIQLPSSIMNNIKANQLKLELHLPTCTLPVRIQIGQRGSDWIEGNFIWDTETDRDCLANCLYSIEWHREFQIRHSYFYTPSDTVLALFGCSEPRQPTANEWQPLLLKTDHSNRPNAYALVANPTFSQHETSLISFHTLDPMELYHCQWITKDHINQAEFKVIEEEPISCLPGNGLDGSTHKRYKVIFSRVN